MLCLLSSKYTLGLSDQNILHTGGRLGLSRMLIHDFHWPSDGLCLIRIRGEERGVERGSARRSSLKGRERVIVTQTNIGTDSKAALGKLLRDGVERILTFPSA